MNAAQINLNLEIGEEIPEISETNKPKVPINHTYNLRLRPT